MLKMTTFNNNHFNIGSKTNVETPPESMLKSFYVVVIIIGVIVMHNFPY